MVLAPLIASKLEHCNFINSTLPNHVLYCIPQIFWWWSRADHSFHVSSDFQLIDISHSFLISSSGQPEAPIARRITSHILISFIWHLSISVDVSDYTQPFWEQKPKPIPSIVWVSFPTFIEGDSAQIRNRMQIIKYVVLFRILDFNNQYNLRTKLSPSNYLILVYFHFLENAP